MSAPRVAIPAETLEKQRRAADPGRSAWVSANAGSGKTFVLTRRVVRLLLAGTRPSAILCLTFTKAAAANMSIRVFNTLAEWVTLDDEALTAAILDTGAPHPGPADLAAARRLFARTVESPGGLKILTIHAFCERLLHSFPFEANVAAGFSVIEDVRQEELLGRAREAVLAAAVAEPASPLGQALEQLGAGLSAVDFATLVRSVAHEGAPLRDAMRTPPRRAAMAAALGEAIGADARDAAAIAHAMLDDGLPLSEWDSVGRALAHAGATKTGEALMAAAVAAPPERLDAYLDVLFTKERQPRKPSYLAKPVRTAEPGLCARLDAEQPRLVALMAAHRAAMARDRTVALLTAACAVLDRYELLKRRAGLLDFADLVERAGELLARSDSAWVLYKLDAGIDHILIDEAQDTSPDQWGILQAISRDFFSGAGASRTLRTVFAVGDEKQSIYSFQGARPAMMQEVHEDMQRRARAAGLEFDSIDLLLSFRSARTVLDTVDRIFAHGSNARGLSAALEKPRPHEALKVSMPGFVELWPKVAPAAVPEPTDWRLPVDMPDEAAPPVVVAKRIADEVARLTANGSGESVEDGDRGRRPVRPGDVLILVRARNHVFDAVIRALKDRNVPVAGADRLNLTDHIATLDLAAAGRAALLPDDDLTLACVLKSPLIGFDDEDLIRLAPGRAGSLDEALRASDYPRDRAAANRLSIWRDRAATLTPFGFYTQLLGADGGRKAMLGRLGPEAADILDEFLALTLAHERDGAPSLLTFLARLEGTSLSIKRDLAAAGDAVRVMTVHAAKGLEAKIVFLPDTCGAPSGRHDAKLFRLRANPPIVAWSPRADDDPAPVALLRDSEREAALDEHRRLLYVALTRAEERLYIAGFHGKQAPPPDCWYDMIVAAGLDLEAVPARWDAGEVVLRRADPISSTAGGMQPLPEPTPVKLPDWLLRPAAPEAPAAPPIRPSHALGAADQPDRPDAEHDAPLGTRRSAALAGRLAHRLLQHLPHVEPARRREVATAVLARQGTRLDEARRIALVDEVLAVMALPALTALFGPGSRAEVAVAGHVARLLGPPLPVVGQIDRITVSPDEVTIADFKSGRPRPAGDTPPAYLAQLALYRAVIQPLYPSRRVSAVLVWTAGPLAVPIGPDLLDDALARVLSSP